MEDFNKENQRTIKECEGGLEVRRSHYRVQEEDRVNEAVQLQMAVIDVGEEEEDVLKVWEYRAQEESWYKDRIREYVEGYQMGHVKGHNRAVKEGQEEVEE